MFLINLFLKLYVRKARNNGQSKRKLVTFKEKICRLAQFIHNVALG